MEIDKLIKANELDCKITELQNILDCFEWTPEDDLGSDKAHPKSISRNPEIIIEFDAADGNSRELIKLPKDFSKAWIPDMKKEISTGLEIYKKEFKEL